MVSNWRRKTLYGPFHRTVKAKGMDTKWSFLWLRKGKTSVKTEALIIAGQDGVIQTRSYKQRILKKQVDPKCRVCGEGRKMVGHIVSGCKPKNFAQYKRRHDRILVCLLRHICSVTRIPVDKQLVDAGTMTSDSGIVLEGDSPSIVVDTKVLTEKAVHACRRDAVLYWEEKKTIVILKVACTKYEQLGTELAAQHRSYAVIVVPIMVGTLGAIGTCTLYSYLDRLKLTFNLIMKIRVQFLIM